jgi:hypothetical protein
MKIIETYYIILLEGQVISLVFELEVSTIKNATYILIGLKIKKMMSRGNYSNTIFELIGVRVIDKFKDKTDAGK